MTRTTGGRRGTGDPEAVRRAARHARQLAHELRDDAAETGRLAGVQWVSSEAERWRQELHDTAAGLADRLLAQVDEARRVLGRAADGDLGRGDLGRGVELQLLAIDDLADSVVDELLGPETGDGPAGTSVGRRWGDGRRWWQVGATGPDRLRGIAVTRSTVRDTVVAALAGQLGSETPAGGATGGAGRG